MGMWKNAGIDRLDRADRNYQILSNFIAFEGLDGAGTTSQAQHLYNRLLESGVRAKLTQEPTSHSIGKMIKRILRQEQVARPETIAYLFAADRNEHIYHPETGIMGDLARGKRVISDRYLFSSLAYQGVDCDLDFVLSLNASFPLPEYCIFLDVAVEQCMQRIESRTNKEMYENKLFQEKVLGNYNKVFDMYIDSEMRIIKVDGNQTQSSIALQIWNEIGAKLV